MRFQIITNIPLNMVEALETLKILNALLCKIYFLTFSKHKFHFQDLYTET